MTSPARFPFVARDAAGGGLMPFVPVTLSLDQSAITIDGLLDTGAAINVLPYSAGVQLGAVWESQTTAVSLTGNLASQEARVLVVSGAVGSFAPVRLAFAWTRNNAVPLLLGQVNFFLEFDVCFFRTQRFVEIRPKV